MPFDRANADIRVTTRARGYVVEVSWGGQAQYFVTFNGATIYKAFATQGQALAAYDLAVQGEWARLQSLQGIEDAKVFVGVVAAPQGKSGTAYVLEIVELVGTTPRRLEYRVLFNGQLSARLAKDEARARASAAADAGFGIR